MIRRWVALLFFPVAAYIHDDGNDHGKDNRKGKYTRSFVVTVVVDIAVIVVDIAAAAAENVGGKKIREIADGCGGTVRSRPKIRPGRLQPRVRSLRHDGKTSLCAESGPVGQIKGTARRPRISRHARVAGHRRRPDLLWAGMTPPNRTTPLRCMALELLGADLEEHRKGSKLSLKMRRARVRHPECLEEIHARGFLHRDLKPSNGMLAPNDGGGPRDRRRHAELFVVDFGLAKDLNADGSHIAMRKRRHGHAPLLLYRTHLGRESSRRDDLESRMYVVISRATASLGGQAENREIGDIKQHARPRSFRKVVICKRPWRTARPRIRRDPRLRARWQIAETRLQGISLV